MCIRDSLSERLLAKRQIPIELKPQPEDDPETVLGVLRHLAMYWAPAAPERRHKRHNVQSRLTVAHGFDGVIEALGGDPDDSLNFGAKVMGDEWAVDNVSAGGFGAIVPQAKSEWVKVGALIAARPEGGANWMVGTVRRVSRVSKDELRVGVETLSRTPAPSRFALPNLQQVQGVLLPPVTPSNGDAAIALRAGAFTISNAQSPALPYAVDLAQPEGGVNWLVGTVRRVSRVSKDELRVGVETLSRTPAPSRFAMRNLQQVQGVILPPVVPSAGDAAIALRAGVYTRGEQLESITGGKHRIYMPQGVAERGDDYEIVKFKEMVREA